MILLLRFVEDNPFSTFFRKFDMQNPHNEIHMANNHQDVTGVLPAGYDRDFALYDKKGLPLLEEILRQDQFRISVLFQRTTKES